MPRPKHTDSGPAGAPQREHMDGTVKDQLIPQTEERNGGKKAGGNWLAYISGFILRVEEERGEGRTKAEEKLKKKT